MINYVCSCNKLVKELLDPEIYEPLEGIPPLKKFYYCSDCDKIVIIKSNGSKSILISNKKEEIIKQKEIKNKTYPKKEKVFEIPENISEETRVFFKMNEILEKFDGSNGIKERILYNLKRKCYKM